MIVEFEGRQWQFDTDDMDVRQAMVLHMAYKMTIHDWSEGFDALDQRTYHFAYWLMLQQNGVVKPLAECNPKVIDFISAVTDARVAAKEEADAKAAAGAGADPTGPPPPGPAGETTGSAAPAFPTATTLTLPVPPPVSTGS